jgi:hypothetical protein
MIASATSPDAVSAKTVIGGVTEVTVTVLVLVTVWVDVPLLQAFRNAMEPMVAPPTKTPALRRNSRRDTVPLFSSFISFSDITLLSPSIIIGPRNAI